MVMLDFIELEIKQAASDFSTIRFARSTSFSFLIKTVGFNTISVIRNFPSTFSKIPLDLQLKAENSNFECSAMAKKVVIRQLLTEAVNKCSGDHILGNPLGNYGGVATSIQLAETVLPSFISGELTIPFRS